jgi:hypothetical protein
MEGKRVTGLGGRNILAGVHPDRCTFTSSFRFGGPKFECLEFSKAIQDLVGPEALEAMQ